LFLKFSRLTAPLLLDNFQPLLSFLFVRKENSNWNGFFFSFFIIPSIPISFTLGCLLCTFPLTLSNNNTEKKNLSSNLELQQPKLVPLVLQRKVIPIDLSDIPDVPIIFILVVRGLEK